MARVRVPSWVRLQGARVHTATLSFVHRWTLGCSHLLSILSRLQEKMKNRRQKIQSDFKNMQSFLREEEKCYLWRLEKENEQVLRKLRDSAASLGQKSHELETCILELERRCAASAQKMLKVRGREGCAPEGWAREPPAWEAGASRRPGSVWPGSVWPGTVWPGSVWPGSVLLLVAPGRHLQGRSPGSAGAFVCVRYSPLGGLLGQRERGPPLTAAACPLRTEPEAPRTLLGGVGGAATSLPGVIVEPPSHPEAGGAGARPWTMTPQFPRTEQGLHHRPGVHAAAPHPVTPLPVALAPGPRGCADPPRAPCWRSPKAVRSLTARLARGSAGEVPAAWEEGGRLPWPRPRAPGQESSRRAASAGTSGRGLFHPERSVSGGQMHVCSPAGAHVPTLTFVSLCRTWRTL